VESLVRGLKAGTSKSFPANKALNNKDIMSLPDNHQNGFLRKLAECFWDHHRPKYYLFCTVASSHGAALLVLSRTIRNQRDFCEHEKEVAAMLCPHLENHLRLRYLCTFWRKMEWMRWFLDHHQLSKREKEIAHLILEGIELDKISERLEISSDTIRDHLKRVYRKLGIHSRTELFASYIRTCRNFIRESFGE
jgi:DNA-binding CsgD family transcriptional regulator